MKLPTKDQKGIHPPKGGFESHTWYLCNVSFGTGNPIHETLLYTGFVTKGVMGGYSRLVSATTVGLSGVDKAYYLESVRKLYTTRW